LAISSVPSILHLERHTRGIGDIQAPLERDTTVLLLGVLEVRIELGPADAEMLV